MKCKVCKKPDVNPCKFCDAVLCYDHNGDVCPMGNFKGKNWKKWRLKQIVEEFMGIDRLTYNGHWQVWSFGTCHGTFRTIPLAEKYCVKHFGKNWYDIDPSIAMIIKEHK